MERQVNELKAKCDQIEKRAAEQRKVEEKKHADETNFLKRTNAQLKVKLHFFILIFILFALSRVFSSSKLFINSQFVFLFLNFFVNGRNLGKEIYATRPNICSDVYLCCFY